MNSPFTLVTLSAGMSMEAWRSGGLLSRELGYFERLSSHVGDIAFLSYGSDRSSEERLMKTACPNGRVLWTHPPLLGRSSGALFLGTWLPPLFPSTFRGCRLVRSNQMSGAWTGMLIARRLRVPFILRCGYLFGEQVEREYASPIVRPILIGLEGLTARAADALIVTYEGAKDYFVKRHAIAPEKITVLGNAVDTDLFRPFETAKTRDAVSVGRLTDQKNLFELVRAASMAGKSLTLVGEGPLRKPLAEHAKKLGADVEFIDPVPNDAVPEILGRHRMFVFPTHYEGNPKALIEAMSCGMPCVASSIPENAALVDDGVHGLLCGFDAESIAGRMREASESALAARLGRNARQRVLDGYSREAIVRREALLHERCIADHVS